MESLSARKVLRACALACAAAVYLSLTGCDRPAGSAGPRPVAVTNVVTVTRTVVVTNEVYLTITNFVEAPAATCLTSRRSAPYVVSTASFREKELGKFLRSAGARILECRPGARALVEAPPKVVEEMRRGGVVTVSPLLPEDKLLAAIPSAGSFKAIIVPTSSIDCAAVAEAVGKTGGTGIEVVAAGSPSVTAELPVDAVRAIASRGDVLKIRAADTK